MSIQPTMSPHSLFINKPTLSFSPFLIHTQWWVYHLVVTIACDRFPTVYCKPFLTNHCLMLEHETAAVHSVHPLVLWGTGYASTGIVRFLSLQTWRQRMGQYTHWCIYSVCLSGNGLMVISRTDARHITGNYSPQKVLEDYSIQEVSLPDTTQF